MKNLFIICLIFLPFAIYAQERKVWDYPVKPGMEEWKKFHSYEERVNACQIPEEILFSLSTEDLTELCLRYPPLYCVFAFNNLNQGLDKLFKEFNGIRELYKRKDVSVCLIKQYTKNIRSFTFLNGKNSDIEKGYFIVSVDALEILLSRIDRQDNDEKDSLKEILQSLVTGYEEKLKYADYFKGSGFQANFYSRSHVISKMNKSAFEQLPQNEKNSVLFSGMTDEQSINAINELSYQLIR